MPWAIEHISDSPLDGHREWLEGGACTSRAPDFSGYTTRVFATRKAARDFIKANHGYIRTRPDLQKPPFCWRMPRAVQVDIVVKRR